MSVLRDWKEQHINSYSQLIHTVKKGCKISLFFAFEAKKRHPKNRGAGLPISILTRRNIKKVRKDAGASAAHHVPCACG